MLGAEVCSRIKVLNLHTLIPFHMRVPAIVFFAGRGGSALSHLPYSLPLGCCNWSSDARGPKDPCTVFYKVFGMHLNRNVRVTVWKSKNPLVESQVFKFNIVWKAVPLPTARTQV